MQLILLAPLPFLLSWRSFNIFPIKYIISYFCMESVSLRASDEVFLSLYCGDFVLAALVGQPRNNLNIFVVCYE
jgi:hypothetical protein